MKRVTAVAMFGLVLALAAGPAPAQDRGRRWTEKAVSVESAHPYPNASSEAVEVRQPGAAEIRLHFAKMEVEESFDFLEILDAQGKVVQRLTGAKENFWTAPVAGDTVRIRVVADQSLSLYGFRIDRLSWRGPEIVVSPVHSLSFELPGGPSLKSGRSAPLTVLGLDRDGRPIELEGHPIYFNIRGPVEVLAVELPHRYKIVAAPDLRVAAEARITAYSGRSSDIRGEFTLKILPARPLASLLVQCRARAVALGKSAEFTVVGKPRDGRGGPENLSLSEVEVELAGPGKIVPVPGGPTARYRYEAPPRARPGEEAVIRVFLAGERSVAGTLTLPIVRTVAALEIRCPVREVAAGETVEIRVYSVPGDRQARPAILPARLVRVTLEGPGRLVPVDPRGDARYRYLAPPVAPPGRVALIQAVLVSDPHAAGRLSLPLVRPFDALDIRTRSARIRLGTTADLDILPRPRPGSRRRPILPAGQLQVKLEGPGRLVPRAGTETGYRYEAPLAPWGAPQAVVSAWLKDDPEVRGTITLSLVRPLYPRPAVVPEVRGLIRFAEYATRESAADPWKSRRIPPEGDLFRNRLQNHRWVFKVDRPRVLQVEVDVFPADDPRKVVRYRESDPSLTVGPQGPVVMGQFKEQFREGRGEYRVVFYVWTGPSTVEKQTIRVLRARKNP